MKCLLATLVAIAAPAVARAQDIQVGPGWEAFPRVEYQGGDATQPKKLYGALVLTDSTVAIHRCHALGCPREGGILLFDDAPLYSIALRTVREVHGKTEIRGPKTISRVLWGVLAGDRKDEYVGLVYETNGSAEAPLFRTEKLQSSAIEAKIRFRLKQLGVEVPL